MLSTDAHRILAQIKNKDLLTHIHSILQAQDSNKPWWQEVCAKNLREYVNEMDNYIENLRHALREAERKAGRK